jgi:hypothetical protein
MKNILTKNLILVLAFVVSAGVANAQTSGTCGDNLTWSFDSGTGTLSITGTGAMNDYRNGSAPWHSFHWSITSLSLSEGLTTIGNGAFYACSNLTVTIPNSVISIGKEAFYSCRELTAIEVDAANQNYSSIDGILYNKTETTLIKCPAKKTGAVKIPNSITAIDDYAFDGCRGLTSVTIPNFVTAIGNHTFGGCIGLTSVIIPNSVTTIGNYAFNDCVGLTSITIPNSVISIGKEAFSYCGGLTSVIIPNSVNAIGVEAFSYCGSLASVTCNATNPPTIFSNTFYNIETKAVFYVPCESLDDYKKAKQWSGFTYGECTTPSAQI